MDSSSAVNLYSAEAAVPIAQPKPKRQHHRHRTGSSLSSSSAHPRSTPLHSRMNSATSSLFSNTSTLSFSPTAGSLTAPSAPSAPPDMVLPPSPPRSETPFAFQAVNPATNPFDDPMTMSLLALSLLRAGARHAVLSVASKAVRDRCLFCDPGEEAELLIGASGGSAELANRMYDGLECLQAGTDRSLLANRLLSSFDDTDLLSRPESCFARYRRSDTSTLHAALEFARIGDFSGICVLAFEPEERRGWVFHDLLVCYSQSWDEACSGTSTTQRTWFDSEAEADEEYKAATQLPPPAKKTTPATTTSTTVDAEEDAYWEMYLPPDPEPEDEENKPGKAVDPEDEDSYWDSYGF